MEKKQLTQKEELKQQFIDRLQLDCSVSPDEASDSQIYQVLSAMMVQRLKHMRQHFVNKTNSIGGKKVYYLSMEFLMGRSLKTTLYNLELVDDVTSILNDYHININQIYEQEPDAGLGNGGLGRLAACYLDAMATQGIPATGHSICYEYGIFRQELQDGWQTEFPDNWLPGGSVWLDPKPDEAIEVHFEGEIQEYWQDSYHYLSHHNYNTVLAIPYDLYVSGYGSEGVSALRLWQAKAPSFDMKSFNEGNYASALSQNSMANAISKVLYPNDNHLEGKSLRLRQQYFLSAAAIGDIVNHHMSVYGTLDNLHEKVAIHINDTHPTLAIPELMRVLLDDCGYTWDHAWHIVTNTFAYTNHTVMAEALEKWDVNLVKQIIPRIFQIIVEINNRYCASLMERNGGDSAKTTRMSIIKDNQIHMATLCVMASHSVNGVSKLHSEIIKESVFHDEYLDTPNKFKNVTNGIAYRRWLYQSNPGLTKLLREKIGNKFLVDGSELKKLDVFENDKAVLAQLRKIKKENKERFAKYVKQKSGVLLNTDSIFDVQVKRLHEYKRQLLNILHVMYLYNELKKNPDMDMTPRTFIFGAKAAAGYRIAKLTIKLINNVADVINNDASINGKIKVVFIENYRVSNGEIIFAAADVSEQISTASKEASGTGNMKFMLNGAMTLGTMDGANVEIVQEVGIENAVIFGLSSDEVIRYENEGGYDPMEIFNNDQAVREILTELINGKYSPEDPEMFRDIYNSLLSNQGGRRADTYFILKDFRSYAEAQKQIDARYKNSAGWAKSVMLNVANAGKFSSDRTIEEYVSDIWKLKKVHVPMN